MKHLIRIGVSILFAIVLLAVMTNNTDVETPRTTYLPIPAASPGVLQSPQNSFTPPDSNSTTLPNETHIQTPAPTADARGKQADLAEQHQTQTEQARTPVSDNTELFVHLPPDATFKQPLRVLVVLHGMGARGDAFAQRLIADSDRNGWLLIAPTFAYRDYMDTKSLMEDDLRFSQTLNATLAALPRRLGIKLRQHALLYGFSRGGQLAHRFALFYPERVETVATLSAGSYTLPIASRVIEDNPRALPFPYGIADYQAIAGYPFDFKQFSQVSFWIAVGSADTRAAEVPRAFDPYVGNNRVQRATVFQEVLKQNGIDVRLEVFPNTGHEITAEMQNNALKFLRDDELFDRLND